MGFGGNAEQLTVELDEQVETLTTCDAFDSIDTMKLFSPTADNQCLLRYPIAKPEIALI